MEDIIICVLLYADDVALLAENDLQQLIIRVANWCRKNHFNYNINLNKTKILKIRPKCKLVVPMVHLLEIFIEPYFINTTEFFFINKN